jgi:hypothetical protein
VTSHRTPLSTITITLTSRVPGGTAATSTTRTGLTDGVARPSTAAFADRLPETHKCTVVLDRAPVKGGHHA